MAPARARSTEAERPRQGSTAGSTAEQPRQPESGGRRTGTINLPFVSAEFHKPDLRLPAVRLPGRREVRSGAGLVVAKARSLSPTELGYYAALAGLAALELVEWPVAVVVGAGTALARSGTRGGGQLRSGQTTEAKANPPPGGRAEASEQA